MAEDRQSTRQFAAALRRLTPQLEIRFLKKSGKP